MDDGGSPLLGLIIFGIFVIVSSIFYAFGSALDNVRESELEEKAQNGDVRAVKVLKMLESPVRFQTSTQTVSTLLGLITGYIGIGMIVRYLSGICSKCVLPFGIPQEILSAVLIVITCLLLVVILMALGYHAPRKIGKQNPEKTIFRYYRFICLVMLLFSPALWLIRVLSGIVVRLFGIDPHKNDDEVTEEEIISMVDEAHEQGVLQENEAEMIQNIIEFNETMARDVMTHRKNILALDGDMFLEDALKIMLDENYSRYPVYQGDIDNIIGIIHVKDAMKQMTYGQMGPIAICDIPRLIREVEFIPETRNIDSIFQYMRNKKDHMVIVIDEYGQTAGLIALEDILEEIVGNILDEYDDDESFIVHQFDDSILMDGLTPLKQVSEVLQTDFENEDYETLNGYLTFLLDHIPNESDEEVCDKGFSFQILKVEKHIIQKVRVERITEEEGEKKVCQDIQNSQT